MNVALTIDDAALEQIAERAAELLAAKMRGTEQAGGRWLRGAEAIAAYLDCPVSRVNAWRQIDLPVQKEGAALVAHTDDLDLWVREGGGKRL